MNMVERVARVINPPAFDETAEKYGYMAYEMSRKIAIIQAKAAIAAMRLDIVGFEKLADGIDADPKSICLSSYFTERDWNAMIDEALKGGEK